MQQSSWVRSINAMFWLHYQWWAANFNACNPERAPFPPKNKGYTLEKYLVKYQIIWVKLWDNVAPHNSCKVMFPRSGLSERNSCQSLSGVTWCRYLWIQLHIFFYWQSSFTKIPFFDSDMWPRLWASRKALEVMTMGNAALGFKGRTKPKENNWNVWDRIANKHHF